MGCTVSAISRQLENIFEETSDDYLDETLTFAFVYKRDAELNWKINSSNPYNELKLQLSFLTQLQNVEEIKLEFDIVGENIIDDYRIVLQLLRVDEIIATQELTMVQEIPDNYSVILDKRRIILSIMEVGDIYQFAVINKTIHNAYSIVSSLTSTITFSNMSFQVAGMKRGTKKPKQSKGLSFLTGLVAETIGETLEKIENNFDMFQRRTGSYDSMDDVKDTTNDADNPDSENFAPCDYLPSNKSPNSVQRKGTFLSRSFYGSSNKAIDANISSKSSSDKQQTVTKNDNQQQKDDTEWKQLIRQRILNDELTLAELELQFPSAKLPSRQATLNNLKQRNNNDDSSYDVTTDNANGGANTGKSSFYTSLLRKFNYHGVNKSSSFDNSDIRKQPKHGQKSEFNLQSAEMEILREKNRVFQELFESKLTSCLWYESDREVMWHDYERTYMNYVNNSNKLKTGGQLVNNEYTNEYMTCFATSPITQLYSTYYIAFDVMDRMSNMGKSSVCIELCLVRKTRKVAAKQRRPSAVNNNKDLSTEIADPVDDSNRNNVNGWNVETKQRVILQTETSMRSRAVSLNSNNGSNTHGSISDGSAKSKANSDGQSGKFSLGLKAKLKLITLTSTATKHDNNEGQELTVDQDANGSTKSDRLSGSSHGLNRHVSDVVTITTINNTTVSSSKSYSRAHSHSRPSIIAPPAGMMRMQSSAVTEDEAESAEHIEYDMEIIAKQLLTIALHDYSSEEFLFTLDSGCDLLTHAQIGDCYEIRRYVGSDRSHVICMKNVQITFDGGHYPPEGIKSYHSSPSALAALTTTHPNNNSNHDELYTTHTAASISTHHTHEHVHTFLPTQEVMDIEFTNVSIYIKNDSGVNCGNDGEEECKMDELLLLNEGSSRAIEIGTFDSTINDYDSTSGRHSDDYSNSNSNKVNNSTTAVARSNMIERRGHETQEERKEDIEYGVNSSWMSYLTNLLPIGATTPNSSADILMNDMTKIRDGLQESGGITEDQQQQDEHQHSDRQLQNKETDADNNNNNGHLSQQDYSLNSSFKWDDVYPHHSSNSNTAAVKLSNANQAVVDDDDDNENDEPINVSRSRCGNNSPSPKSKKVVMQRRRPRRIRNYDYSNNRYTANSSNSHSQSPVKANSDVLHLTINTDTATVATVNTTHTPKNESKSDAKFCDTSPNNGHNLVDIEFIHDEKLFTVVVNSRPLGSPVSTTSSL